MLVALRGMRRCSTCAAEVKDAVQRQENSQHARYQKVLYKYMWKTGGTGSKTCSMHIMRRLSTSTGERRSTEAAKKQGEHEKEYKSML